MIYTIYNPTTGQILQTIHGDNADWIQSNLDGKNYVEGDYNAKDYYIDNNQAVAKPTNPSIGGQKYNFDYTTKSWIYDTVASATALRKYRNDELTNVDKINPTWYSSLTTDQQTELQQYRQDLLNIPQQSGFPTTVTWPTKPSWL